MVRIRAAAAALNVSHLLLLPEPSLLLRPLLQVLAKQQPSDLNMKPMEERLRRGRLLLPLPLSPRVPRVLQSGGPTCVSAAPTMLAQVHRLQTLGRI